jgi:hypothetical protein
MPISADTVVFCVCLAIFGFFLGTFVEKDRSKYSARCENTETKKLVSERQFKDGTVECVYVQNRARTMKEILNGRS